MRRFCVNGSRWLGLPPLPNGEVPRQWQSQAVSINSSGAVVGFAWPFDPDLTDLEEDVYWGPASFWLRDLRLHSASTTRP